jgi:hypothetical protein
MYMDNGDWMDLIIEEFNWSRAMVGWAEMSERAGNNLKVF